MSPPPTLWGRSPTRQPLRGCITVIGQNHAYSKAYCCYFSLTKLRFPYLDISLPDSVTTPIPVCFFIPPFLDPKVTTPLVSIPLNPFGSFLSLSQLYSPDLQTFPPLSEASYVCFSLCFILSVVRLFAYQVISIPFVSHLEKVYKSCIFV